MVSARMQLTSPPRAGPRGFAPSPFARPRGLAPSPLSRGLASSPLARPRGFAPSPLSRGLAPSPLWRKAPPLPRRRGAAHARAPVRATHCGADAWALRRVQR
ncbi:hypothetical protein M885DRAFT_514269 [Pelagophyceae sp. CCMP2097]|nr:hypothetical protein M885DRAFT_514269 [Pelagophyceae sp. CCMP2097]